MGSAFPSQLTLSHKLTDPEPVGPDNTLADRIRLRGDNVEMFATRLSSEKKVVTVFPQHPPEDHVHILVQLPSTSKTMRCSVD